MSQTVEEPRAGAAAADGRGVRRVKASLERQSMLVAAVCLVADASAFLSAGSLSGLRSQDWLVLAAVIVVDAALALPARWSGWVAVAQAVVRVLAAVVLAGVQIQREANDAGLLIAGYRAGAWLRGGPASLALLALACGVGIGQAVSNGHGPGPGVAIEIAKSAVLPWLVGRYTTTRGAYIAELEQRAENQRRDAQDAVKRAVAEERSSIARDLHDVISHHVSAIGMHAGAARLGLGSATRPSTDVLAESLSTVEAASRAAMLDLRRLLDLLHGTTGDAARQPGLDNLDELLDGVRRAGLPTRLSITGAPRALPQSLDIALYRISQEMLTNALRHGDGTVVDVELQYQDTSITLRTRNGIASASAAVAATNDSGQPQQPGRGLHGMRTRAAIFDGTISHGPDRTGHTWESAVTVPLAEQP